MLLHYDAAHRAVCLVPSQPSVDDMTMDLVMRFSDMPRAPAGMTAVRVEVLPVGLEPTALDPRMVYQHLYSDWFTYDPDTDTLWYQHPEVEDPVNNDWWLWSAAVYWRDHLRLGNSFTSQLHSLLLRR